MSSQDHRESASVDLYRIETSVHDELATVVCCKLSVLRFETIQKRVIEVEIGCARLMDLMRQETPLATAAASALKPALQDLTAQKATRIAKSYRMLNELLLSTSTSTIAIDRNGV